MRGKSLSEALADVRVYELAARYEAQADLKGPEGPARDERPAHVETSARDEPPAHSTTSTCDGSSTRDGSSDCAEHAAPDRASSPDGSRAEALVVRVLVSLGLDRGLATVVHDLWVPTRDGRFEQVDIAYVTSRGVFVVESKDYAGWIFGSGDDERWTQCLPGGKRNRFYNPVRQNAGHVRWLGELLGASVPLWSVVMFSERGELKDVTGCGDACVTRLGDLADDVRRMYDEAPVALSSGEMARVVGELEDLTHPSDEVRRAHDGRVSRIERGLECPWCGRPLVERAAHEGGRRFVGCTGYPVCTYARRLGG